MKNYFIRAIFSAVAFTVVCLLLDLLFRDMQSVREYAVQAVVFGILFGLFNYLDDKDWNSSVPFRWYFLLALSRTGTRPLILINLS